MVPCSTYRKNGETMSTAARMPVIFFGHGSPMNALEDNRYTKTWEDFGKKLPRPKAILAVSAHWTTRGTAVTATQAPATIHDFGRLSASLVRHALSGPGRSRAGCAGGGNAGAAAGSHGPAMGSGPRHLVGTGQDLSASRYPCGATQHRHRKTGCLPFCAGPETAGPAGRGGDDHRQRQCSAQSAPPGPGHGWPRLGGPLQ